MRTSLHLRGIWMHASPAVAARLLVAALLTMASGVGAAPFAYIPNSGAGTVSVIDVATNTVTTTVTVGAQPYGVGTTSDGTRVFISNQTGNTVSVIDTATNTVIATIAVGTKPSGIAVSPTGPARMWPTSRAGASR